MSMDVQHEAFFFYSHKKSNEKVNIDNKSKW